MAIDLELDRLLEELDNAVRKEQTRGPLIDDALIELASAEFVTLDSFPSFGRQLKINDEVRIALTNAAKEEKEELSLRVQEAREKVIERRMTLV